MLTESEPIASLRPVRFRLMHQTMPPLNYRRFGSALSAIALLFAMAGQPALADDQNNKGGEAAAQSGDPAKEGQKRADEIAEAARLIKGRAGSAECVWTGRRIVSLLWRDDLDTAGRHRALYEQFGCPEDHVQAAFRCVVRQGDIDPKAQGNLNERVHSCWINPEAPPSPPQQATTATPQGTATP